MFIAERQGFEPREPLGSTVFKTAAIDHSAIFPIVLRSNVSFDCFAKVVILLEYTRVLCAFFLFVYSFLLRIECVGIPFLLLFL